VDGIRTADASRITLTAGDITDVAVFLADPQLSRGEPVPEEPQVRRSSWSAQRRRWPRPRRGRAPPDRWETQIPLCVGRPLILPAATLKATDNTTGSKP
jgi:hypothetical protein